MDTLLYSLLVIGMLLTFWAWACNENTALVRKHILNCIGTDRDLLADYDKISYRQHFRRELRLGNPIELYSGAIQHRIAVVTWLGQ